MRILDTKEIRKYTGCILTGAHRYAYFPVYKNSIIPEPHRKYINEYTHANIYRNVLKSLKISVQKFLLIDIDLCNIEDAEKGTQLDNYSLTLELYVKGEVSIRIKLELGKPNSIDLHAFSRLMAGLIYLLSSVTEYQNIRVEYFWMERMNEPYIFGSTDVVCPVDFTYTVDGVYCFDCTFGISFDAPSEFKEFDNEQMLLFSDISAGEEKWDAAGFYPFILSGYIRHVPERNKFYLFKASRNGTVFCFEFNGEVEFENFEPKELFGITLQDVMTEDII